MRRSYSLLEKGTQYVGKNRIGRTRVSKKSKETLQPATGCSKRRQDEKSDFL